MKNILILLFISSLFTGCAGNSKNSNDESTGEEFHCISYRAKNNPFSKTYGANVYYEITLGNKSNAFAAMAILADEEGFNVFGKLIGGQAGLETIVEGTYKIENGNVIINWKNNNVLETLPNSLQIEVDNFTNKRINSKVTSLKDSKNQLTYTLHESWNVK